MSTPIQSVIIVGAGAFGVSTALHFRKLHPYVQVTLIDRIRENRGAASSDHNKIIRADYPDEFYMKLALEAQESWRNNPIYSPYYHETGMLFAEEIGMGRAAFKNFKHLNVDQGATIMSTVEALERFPIFKGANWEDVTENYFNPSSGWGEAHETMESVFRAALAEGVQFLEATVDKLILDPTTRACLGVRTSDGKEIFADRTVLAVGAYTAKVLADTDPRWAELQVDGRMVAAAAIQCTATYPPEEDERLSQAPVHFLGMWHTHGESIPPFKGKLKLNCEVSFTSMTYHDGLKKEISIPPKPESQSTFSHDVCEGLKQEVGNVVKNVYGDHVKGINIESYRMCWDAVSPNQSFIIDYHPACDNLVIAGAGSFHSWKFLPTIGKYVVQRLFNELDDEKKRMWAWDRENEGAACEMYIPSRDVKTIGPFQGWPRTEGTQKSVLPYSESTCQLDGDRDTY
ncbi:FAD dependent oxidoreductase [Podospora australis]|uniref:FAD dependent oxidoreductase n=1 Tax=Podospora australis TaxID=1536484 RepID=A0AAN6WNU2_9PEZI|nr:FAD dependent oxidoreductase [Podospora australis]